MIQRSHKTPGRRLRLTERPVALGLLVAVFCTGLHSYLLYREFQHLHGEIPPFFIRLHLLFVLAFLTCVIGLLLRSRRGLILSIFSLVGVLANYALWYQVSLPILKEFGGFWALRPTTIPVPSHSMGLINAYWFNIAILYVVVIILAWQVKFLISTFRQPRTK
jgi:hypothetical protein